MHGESPELKRCCFCLPLRRGLIGWGYTKLVLNILSMIYFGFVINYYAFNPWRHLEAKTIVILSFIEICLLLDMAFDIIFIVAGHKKNVTLLRISYIYNMVWLGLLTLGNCFQLYMNLSIAYRLWSYIEYRKYITFDLLTNSGLAFSLIFVQIYLILLIRSEMIKLRHQTLGMQYTNYAASGEPQCTLHSTSDQYTVGEKVVENCFTDKKTGVENCCTDKKPGVENFCTDKKPSVEDCCTDKEQVVQNCCTKEKCNKVKGYVAL
ncbi:uncharacterized protein LOC134747646 [Cydia strobilella]|uniref:uncharacterized protein LOC134747646 n=1 Tax=Cydia strobilella TaxID=1100964 RepID=UPI00300477DC